MKKKLISTCLLLLTAMIWGTAFVAQAKSDALPAMTFNGVRFLLGAASLIPVCLIFEKEKDLTPAQKKARHKNTLLPSLVSGTILFIASGLQQFGILYTGDPGKSAFITGLYTALTPVLYVLIFRKRAAWNKWIGVVFATVGLYMLCLKPEDGFVFGLPELVLFISAFFWAGHILSVDYYLDRVSTLRFSCWQFVVCGIENLIFAAIFERPTAAGFKGALWPILYCGLLSVGVAYTCQIIGQKMSEPTFAAIVFSTESVFAAIGGVLWNMITPAELHVNQQITPIGYVGCGIIFLGIVLSQVDLSALFRKKKASPTEEIQQ